MEAYSQTVEHKQISEIKDATDLYDYSDTSKQVSPEELDQRTTSKSFISPQEEVKREDHSNIKLNDKSLVEEDKSPSSRQHHLPLKKKPE